MIQLSSSSARRDHSCDRETQVQERNRGEFAAVNLAGKDRTHSCSRFPFLSFSLCCGSFFEDRSVRNGYCWAWLQRTIERRRVIKTLLDAGVESTRGLSERSGSCKAPNETKEKD